MKTKSVILNLIISTLLISCGEEMPNSPCACDENVHQLDSLITFHVETILPYNEMVKKNYNEYLNQLMDAVKQKDKMVHHCDEVYSEKGYCKTEENERFVIWNGGEYLPIATMNYVKMYEKRYTGNWEEDSIVNSIANPAVAHSVLLQIWYREEIKAKLSPYQLSVKDSLKTQYDRRRKNRLNGKRPFPGMDNKKPKN